MITTVCRCAIAAITDTTRGSIRPPVRSPRWIGVNWIRGLCTTSPAVAVPYIAGPTRYTEPLTKLVAHLPERLGGGPRGGAPATPPAPGRPPPPRVGSGGVRAPEQTSCPVERAAALPRIASVAREPPPDLPAAIHRALHGAALAGDGELLRRSRSSRAAHRTTPAAASGAALPR